jgi:hypothetical protein
VQFIPPAWLFLTVSLMGRASGRVAFRAFTDKFIEATRVVRNYSKPLDGITILLFLLLFAAAVFTRRLTLAKGSRWCCVLAVLVYFAMPMRLATGSFVDSRFPIVVAFLVIAAVDVRLPGPRMVCAIAGVFLLLFLVRTGVLWKTWREGDGFYRQYLTAIENLPRGSRVMPIYYPEQDAFNVVFPYPVQHVPCYAIMQREALVPSLFTFETQQPLRLRSPWREAAQKAPPLYPGKHPNWDVIRGNYDFVLVLRRDVMKEISMPPNLTVVTEGPNVVLFSTH